VGTTNIGSRAPNVPLLYGVAQEVSITISTADDSNQNA
jgi:hypothetical protein